ncbi:MAG: S-methyl-5-thioribose-1-phosphate isomerase [Spirochaetia bacterium]|nr:S-methyl-5-thioribose-1-phosphate isomerase [Spirochaetia bacterium]
MNTIIPVMLDESEKALYLLDQTQLPEKEIFLVLDKREDIFEAILKLRVRGAPAIGIAAAFGMYVCLLHGSYATINEMVEDASSLKAYLASSRPTAVNLFWALERMEKKLLSQKQLPGASIEKILASLKEESYAILTEDQEMSKAIGEHGLTLFKKGMGIMTHCNAGGLATSGYGTALAPIYLGQERGYDFKVYSNESRPLLQGSRLTSYELFKAGIDVTVLCDSMASIVMNMGKIDAIIVGADRIAANGDTANKIGTSGVAIIAKEYGIPFYVAAPTSTFDLNTLTGDDIPIEERDGEEVINGFGRRTGPIGVKVFNPAFDVTKASYITAIITEKGLITDITTQKVKAHMNQ